LAQFLNRKDVRGILETQGRIFLSNAINKLSAFQRFFISAGQYDRTLSEKMPEIIDDLIIQVQRILAEQYEKKNIFDFFTDSAASFLVSPENGEHIAKTAANFLHSYLDKPLKELANADDPQFFEKFQNLGRNIFIFLKKYIEDRFFNEEKSGENAKKKEKLLEKYGDWTISGVFAITGGKKERLDAFLTEKILALADGQIGSVLQSINIQALVAERVDELEMLRVERIILDIMASQLKWINIFGAILGAFIGLFQSLFSFFYK
jgi:uncharacterized membrane protein YheB (UPF0754 family)